MNDFCQGTAFEKMRRDIGVVAVLYGGLSHERQVSLWSGKAIYDALQVAGVDSILIDVGENFLEVVTQRSFDYAFIALHGRGGEDGTVQAILDWANIPYVGSGVCASAIAMDKVRTKQLWKAAGLPVLPQMLLSENFRAEDVVGAVGLPMAIKPALEGSSNGITKVETLEEVVPAFEKARLHDSVVMAEQWVDGDEYTGAIINGDALPLIRIDAGDGGMYDFEAKYVTGAREYQCPCGLSSDNERNVQDLLLKAAYTIGIKDWARVDVIIDQSGQPWLIEINTIPGMTETSLVPKATQALGIDFTNTVIMILQRSWERHNA